IDKSFLTISAAIAVATSGDVIVVGPGTFTENSGIVIPDNVSLYGAGIGRTTIQSTVTLQTPIIKPGNNSIIADLTSHGTVSNDYQAVIGIGTSSNAATGVKLF